jgi:hypothetical protein
MNVKIPDKNTTTTTSKTSTTTRPKVTTDKTIKASNSKSNARSSMIKT